MKSLKKFTAAFAFILALAQAVPAGGTETMDIGMKELAAAENVLTVYAGSDVIGVPVAYTIEVDGSACDILSVSSVGEEQQGISYVFLADISGSLKGEQLEALKTTLYALVAEMKETDNACLMLVGDTANALNFTGDKAELTAQIDAIANAHEDTNLYYAIDKALDVLAKSEAAQTPKCLVVLSDGQDDWQAGITKAEVDEKIDASHITVCSVVPQMKKNDTEKEEAAKLLGSFSRRSPGGVHQLLGNADLTPEKAAAAVADAMNHTLILKADIRGFSSTAGEVYVEVQARADGYGNAADGYFVNTTVLSKGVTAPEPTATETVTEKPEEPQAAEEPTAMGTMPLLLLGGGILVLFGAVTAIFIRRKKKAAAEEAAVQPEILQVPVMTGNAVAEEGCSSKFEAVAEADTVQPQAKAEPQQEAVHAEPVLKVVLMKVGLIETEEREIAVGREFRIGRKPEQNDLAFPQDAKISAVHCRLSYNGEALSIEDMGSMNGTRVNGVPITRKYQLINDDVIAFGDNEWRVQIW